MATATVPALPTVRDICASFDLSEEARALLRPGMSAWDFAAVLVEHEHFVPGIDFLAHAMCLRNGVWWACLCIQHACGKEPSAQDRAALLAATVWVLQPTDQNRASTGGPAQSAGPVSPAGRVASAVSVGNVPPNMLPGRESADAIAAAVKLASVKAEPARISAVQRQFVELGMKFAGAPTPAKA